METRILSTNDPSALAAALDVLRHGGVIAFPTDTVYGVGAHAFQPEAVRQLYVAKNRPAEKAIPLLIASAADLSLVAAEVPKIAWRLADRLWPGGLTLVVPRHPRVPDAVSSGPTVAVRGNMDRSLLLSALPVFRLVCMGHSPYPYQRHLSILETQKRPRATRREA